MTVEYRGTARATSFEVNGCPVEIIDMFVPWVQCCLCGIHCPSTHGIPVDSGCGIIVANDFEGEWGGMPACKSCHDRHALGEFVGTWPKF